MKDYKYRGNKMALKDIFTMIKADRYTADGCEEIKKAQKVIKEETADSGLPDGTMRHRKDGDYIKQAGKWVPAKRANGGAKKPEEKRKFDQRKYGTSPAAKEDAIRASIVERMTPEQREAVMNGRTLRTVKEGQGVIDITKEDLEFFDKHNAERKPTESKPAESTPSLSKEDKIRMLSNSKHRSFSSVPVSEWKETYSKLSDKELDEAYDDFLKFRNPDDYKAGGKFDYAGRTGDSAPRVLTGDCKIRIRKSK